MQKISILVADMIGDASFAGCAGAREDGGCSDVSSRLNCAPSVSSFAAAYYII
jgi:hypothetical protein